MPENGTSAPPAGLIISAQLTEEFMTKPFDDYAAHARHLELIAETLDKGSPEYLALERAGWALAFAIMHHQREFQEFLDELQRGELSPDQQGHLRKLGLK